MTTPAVRSALLLGGTSDIGLAVVGALRDLGLKRVVLAMRDVDGGDPLGGDERVEVSRLRWDALEIDSHEAMVDAAFDELGTVDVVVCAVGVLGHHAGASMGPVEVDQMVRTNFAGPAAALSAVGGRLARQGHGTIVVLSSVAAARPRRSNFVYGSSKAGLDAFAHGMGDALVDDGVDVVVVRPGFVRSSMTVGLEPAPFATDPDTVAAAVVEAIGRSGSGVVWVPARLGPLFAVLGATPQRLWRRIAADR